MAPRRYRMDARRERIDATRNGIVQAAMGLHARQGALATSWEEVALAAGVSRATVYHHFHGLDDLVPACAQAAFAAIEVPTPDQAAQVFAGLATPEAKLERFVRESCRCYETGADWLRAAWRERDLVPAMGDAVDQIQRGLRVLLDAVLEGASVGPEGREVLVALLDFPFWESLDRTGVARQRIAAHIESLALAWLEGART